ncbi:MAG: hypothetical protein NT023_12510 [Armatimonadetes bacterium]|nr:hypothetical protein [Armatimonadota bacterium]
MMSKCPDIDKSESGVSPARVRMSALILVREEASHISKGNEIGGHGVRRNVRHKSDASPDMESVKSPPELETGY